MLHLARTLLLRLGPHLVAPAQPSRAENVRADAKNVLDPKWCHPLYFAAQMFDSVWRPRDVFSGQGIDWKNS